MKIYASYTRRNYKFYWKTIRRVFNVSNTIDYLFYDKHGGIQAKKSFDDSITQDKYSKRFVDRYTKNGCKIGFCIDDSKYHLIDQSNYYYDNINKVYWRR